MDSILIKVNNFKVKYKQATHAACVEVYVNGNLNEDRQDTWYLRKLLDETISLKQQVSEWRSEYEKLETIAKDYIDNHTLEELLKED